MQFEVEVDVRRATGFRLTARFSCRTDALALVGPSGAGKSTLLDLLAGVQHLGTRSASGRILLDGEDVTRVPLAARRVGYVTQDALLFPHLDVRRNLTLSPRASGLDEIVSALDLAPLLARRPRHLSGGERRRVALARALASSPRLLLLDEPFAGLDDVRRRDALSLLAAVRRRFGVPLVLVSHQAEEVVGLAEHALRLRDGTIVAQGAPPTVLRPGELGIDNHFTARVLGPGRVAWEGVELAVSLPAEPGTEVRLACYAHDVLLATERPRALSARNVFPAEVAAVQPVADSCLVALRSPPLRATLTPLAVRELALVPGTRVVVLLKATAVCYLGPA